MSCWRVELRETKREKLDNLVELWRCFWNFVSSLCLIMSHNKKYLLLRIVEKLVEDRNLQHLSKSHISLYVPVNFTRSRQIWIPLSKLNRSGLVGFDRKNIFQRANGRKLRYAHFFSQCRLCTQNKQNLILASCCHFSSNRSNWSNRSNLRTKNKWRNSWIREGVILQPVKYPKKVMKELSKGCKIFQPYLSGRFQII